MGPARLQRVFGLGMFLFGVAATLVVWQSPTSQPDAVRRAIAIAPAFVIFGLAMAALPGPRAERERRGDDLWELSGLQVVTLRWWAVFVISVSVAAANCWALKVGWHF